MDFSTLFIGFSFHTKMAGNFGAMIIRRIAILPKICSIQSPFLPNL